MSRHTINKGEDRCVVYGFDRPLSEYFIQIWNEGDIILMRSGGAGTVLETLEEYGVTLPDEHMAALFLDVPITDEPRPGNWAIDPVKWDAAVLKDKEENGDDGEANPGDLTES